MFTISKPRYQKTQKGPSYQFDIQYKGSIEDGPFTFLLEADIPLTVDVLEGEIRTVETWWLTFLAHFLSSTTSYFSRPYTVPNLQRILRHRLDDSSSSSSASPASPASASSLSTFLSLPRHVSCLPRMIELTGGVLWVHWVYYITPAGIDIPDEDEESSLPALREIEEWDADAVPEEVTTESVSVLTNPAMLLERQRVKEARLRAKLAMYRAQIEMNRYYEKYGGELSDSEEDEEEDE